MLGPASLGTVSKEHCLFQKNGGDKSPRGVLALCTLSPATLSLSLSQGLREVTALRTFTLCSQGNASSGQLSR